MLFLLDLPSPDLKMIHLCCHLLLVNLLPHVLDAFIYNHCIFCWSDMASSDRIVSLGINILSWSRGSGYYTWIAYWSVALSCISPWCTEHDLLL